MDEKKIAPRPPFQAPAERIKTLRLLKEEQEEKTLSPFACLSSKSRGRKIPEPPCPVRTDFQRDRDRILYSKSFRRLMHKTQVFIAPEGDHFRTRLTHTIEVSQIARTIARGLNLNEDLTEAVCLGHDLGHAPFGHAGEKSLSTLMKKYTGTGFHHSQQSLRVVDVLEKEGGLNLTYEVRNGILAHSKGSAGIKEKAIFEAPATLEAQIVRISDRLAYISHDIDDAVRADIIREEDIPPDLRDMFGIGISDRIHRMVMNVVENSWQRDEVRLSDDMREGLDRLKDFMFKNVYSDSPAKEEEFKAKYLIEQIFEHIIRNPCFIPLEILERGSGKTGEHLHELFSIHKGKEPQEMDGEYLDIVCRGACDFIAGMTDRFAISFHNQLFVPRGWNIKVV